MQARLLRNSVANRVEAGPSYQLALSPPLELLMFHAVQKRKEKGKRCIHTSGPEAEQAARARAILEKIPSPGQVPTAVRHWEQRRRFL